MDLRLGKALATTEVAGPGKRFAIWVQGCSKKCEGCYNQDLWDLSLGTNVNTSKLISEIINTSDIEGVTLLGGEPFDQPKALHEIAKEVRRHNLSVIAYSGYTLEELKSANDTDINKLLSVTDLLIDGSFEISKRENSRPLVGSSNQNFHFLTTRYTHKNLQNCENAVEIHIAPNGTITLNGQTDNSIDLKTIIKTAS